MIAFPLWEWTQLSYSESIQHSHGRIYWTGKISNTACTESIPSPWKQIHLVDKQQHTQDWFHACKIITALKELSNNFLLCTLKHINISRMLWWQIIYIYHIFGRQGWFTYQHYMASPTITCQKTRVIQHHSAKGKCCFCYTDGGMEWRGGDSFCQPALVITSTGYIQC